MSLLLTIAPKDCRSRNSNCMLATNINWRAGLSSRLVKAFAFAAATQSLQRLRALETH